MDTLLPLGTIISLEEEKQAMIIGYYPYDSEENRMYQYLITSFPLGISEDSSVAMLDGQVIQKVIHEGYENDESTDYLNAMQKIGGEIYKVLNTKKKESIAESFLADEELKNWLK